MWGGTGCCQSTLVTDLILRTVQPADTEQLVAFKADTHRAPGAPEPDAYVAAWTRDLLERPHPTFRTDWFLVVEETASNRIVSSLNMIPQTWTYGGIQIPVGRVEMVSTDPAYRRRGLVRRQIEVVHRWGDEMGHLAQVIIGIHWYYRQFGYEYAVGYGGRRIVDLDHIPGLPPGTHRSRFGCVQRHSADLPFFAKTFNEGGSRYAVTCLATSPSGATSWRAGPSLNCSTSLKGLTAGPSGSWRTRRCAAAAR